MAINTPVSGGGGSVTSAAVVTALDGADSIPDATPVSGDKILFKDTSDSNNLKEMDYDDLPGAGGGLSNIVEDVTPQAGGSFDVNGQEIVSVGGTDIVLHSDNELIIELGDAAGVDSVIIRDSASVEVAAIDSDGNITTSGTVDGRDIATDGTKLDGIETAATADQTDAEIRAAVEAATDSNVFTDADHTKLNGIEASADVTDATNVTAAGALMDSEVTNLSGIKTLTVPDSTTITTFAATLTDDTTAAAARTTLGVDAAGTDNAPAASATTAGKVELATQAEVNTGTDTARVITCDTLEGHLNGNATITDGKYEGSQTSLIGTITTVDIECGTGIFFEHTVAGTVTFTLSGIPASPNIYVMRLRIVFTSGSVVWTNFTALEWAGGAAPTLAGGEQYDCIMSTDDGGTTWFGIANEGYS